MLHQICTPIVYPQAELVLCLQSHKIECADESCFYRPGHICTYNNNMIYFYTENLNAYTQRIHCYCE